MYGPCLKHVLLVTSTYGYGLCFVVLLQITGSGFRQMLLRKTRKIDIDLVSARVGASVCDSCSVARYSNFQFLADSTERVHHQGKRKIKAIFYAVHSNTVLLKTHSFKLVHPHALDHVLPDEGMHKGAAARCDQALMHAAILRQYGRMQLR